MEGVLRLVGVSKEVGKREDKGERASKGREVIVKEKGWGWMEDGNVGSAKLGWVSRRQSYA